MTNSNTQGHWPGHLLARKHQEHRPTHPNHGLQIWHNTPGQYIECTCKLTTTMQQGKTITWHKLMYISELTCEHHIMQHIINKHVTRHNRSSSIIIALRLM